MRTSLFSWLRQGTGDARVILLPAMVFSFSTRSTHHQTPSKLIIRSISLATVLVLSLCSIVYLTRSFPGYSVKTNWQRLLPAISDKTQVKLHWDGSPRRLIVFGDSWSDNGQYPINPPSPEQAPARDEAQGKVWTDWLCSSVGPLCVFLMADC